PELNAQILRVFRSQEPSQVYRWLRWDRVAARAIDRKWDRLVQEVCARIGFDEKVEAYVVQEPSFDVLAVRSPAITKVPHLLKLPYLALNQLCDPELLAIIGHEIGHLKFRHGLFHRMFELIASAHEPDKKHSSLPLLLKYRMRSWVRLAEFSA